MPDKKVDELKNKMSESKRNMKIGASLTIAGTAVDFAIANFHIHDLTVLSVMSSFIVVPVMVTAFNANEYRLAKKKMNGKALKKLKGIN